MVVMRWITFTFMLTWAGHGLAQDVTPEAILERVSAAYSSMQTFQGEGTITSDIDIGSGKITTTTEFSMVLMKPNLYRISWAQKDVPMPGMEQAGTVWSDGTQPFVYMSAAKAYAKMGNDMFALSAATGISGGAAYTIPSLFLTVDPEPASIRSRLVDPKLEKAELVGNEECYVISGSAQDLGRETFWISKSRYLILKYWRSFEPAEGGLPIPELTDADLQAALKGMSLEVTEENKQLVRTMMKQTKERFSSNKVRGSSAEVYTRISNPNLDKKDFDFAPPADATLKKTLFGGDLGIPK